MRTDLPKPGSQESVIFDLAKFQKTFDYLHKVELNNAKHRRSIPLETWGHNVYRKVAKATGLTIREVVENFERDLHQRALKALNKK